MCSFYPWLGWASPPSSGRSTFLPAPPWNQNLFPIRDHLEICCFGLLGKFLQQGDFETPSKNSFKTRTEWTSSRLVLPCNLTFAKRTLNNSKDAKQLRVQTRLWRVNSARGVKLLRLLVPLIVIVDMLRLQAPYLHGQNRELLLVRVIAAIRITIVHCLIPEEREIGPHRFATKAVDADLKTERTSQKGKPDKKRIFLKHVRDGRPQK